MKIKFTLREQKYLHHPMWHHRDSPGLTIKECYKVVEETNLYYKIQDRSGKTYKYDIPLNPEYTIVYKGLPNHEYHSYNSNLKQ